MDANPRQSADEHEISLHDISAHEFLAAMHDQDGAPSLTETETDTDTASDADSTLLAHMTKQKTVHPGDMRRVLSSTMSKYSKGSGPPNISANETTPSKPEMTINGKTYRAVNQTTLVYDVSQRCVWKNGALVDRGANGGIGGDDVRVVEELFGQKVHVRGIDNHELTDIPLITAGGVIPTQDGEVIAIMHNYAYTGRGKSIHSPAQMEWFGHDVQEQSVRTGGLQRIKTSCGHYVPINVRGGLPYISMRPYANEEWEKLPHVFLTSPKKWDPSVLDFELEDDTEWFDAISSVEENPHTNLFDCQGNYRKRYKAGHPTDEPTDEPMYFDAQAHIESSGENGETVYAAYPTERVASTKDPPTVTPADHDYKALRPNFAYLPEETIKKTFENTTQYGTIPQSEILKKRFKSPNPALNVA